ncbi:MAG: bifunctional pyr operon transcriptional regulator/uracil phosphoribosyltransferase PyrR [Burkholderiaceae bacterium]|jgi:pyrimidine operon attenuation protein/uracil phosphoribosyltransferase
MTLPDPEDCYAALRAQVARALPDRSNILLAGIYSGGAWIAERLHADLGFARPCGFLDSALYRDDFSSRGLGDAPRPARLPCDVNGAQILLVDDVLYTGRTIRAIVNHLFDYGRPASIALAVLLDRGGRQLPIEAAYVGARLDLPAGQGLVLTREPDGRLRLALETGDA